MSESAAILADMSTFDLGKTFALADIATRAMPLATGTSLGDFDRLARHGT
jgi:hypothetical protein